MPDTLLDYAQPLLERLPDDHTLDDVRAMLQFAAVVWNVVLVRDIPGAVAHLSTKMPPPLRLRPAKALSVIRRMLTPAIGICPDPRCCGPQAAA